MCFPQLCSSLHGKLKVACNLIFLSLCPRYDEELGVVYMVAKLAGGYAAVKRVLNEVK